MDLREKMPANKKITKEKAKELYDVTIRMAAALENLMNERAGNEGEVIQGRKGPRI